MTSNFQGKNPKLQRACPTLVGLRPAKYNFQYNQDDEIGLKREFTVQILAPLIDVEISELLALFFGDYVEKIRSIFG